MDMKLLFPAAVSLVLVIGLFLPVLPGLSQGEVDVGWTFALKYHEECLDLMVPAPVDMRQDRTWKRTVSIRVIPAFDPESQITLYQSHRGEIQVDYWRIREMSVTEHLDRLRKSLGNLEDSASDPDLEPLCSQIPVMNLSFSKEDIPELGALVAELESLQFPVFEWAFFLDATGYSMAITTLTNSMEFRWSGFSGTEPHPLVSWIQALEKALQRAGSRSHSEQAVEGEPEEEPAAAN